MDFQNEMNRLQEMLNLRNLNQDPPIDLYDLKGSDEGDNMIDSLTIEPSDILLLGDEVINTTPERENDKFIKSSVDDLVPIPRESEMIIPISYDLTFSNPLFDFNDDYTLCKDNPLFDEEFEDISSLDPPELTLVIDEPTLLDTLPLPCTNVLGDAIVDTDLLLGKQLDTLSIKQGYGNDFNPVGHRKTNVF
ncbi:hypothetical protein Tco_0883574 [Tanacetum coccineum]